MPQDTKCIQRYTQGLGRGKAPGTQHMTFSEFEFVTLYLSRMRWTSRASRILKILLLPFNPSHTASVIFTRWGIHPQASTTKSVSSEIWPSFFHGRDLQLCEHIKKPPIYWHMGVLYLCHYQSQDAITYACHNQANKGMRHAPGWKTGGRQVDGWHSMQAVKYTQDLNLSMSEAQNNCRCSSSVSEPRQIAS